MFKIESFEKEGRSNRIRLFDPEDVDDEGNPLHPRTHFILDGYLEAYMGAYGLAAGAALTLLLADGHVDGVECPELQDPDCRHKVAKIMATVPQLFDWSEVDRDEMLAQITLADDKAADLVNTWAAMTQTALTQPDLTYDEVQQVALNTQTSYAAGIVRREEELLADDMMEQYKPEATTFNTGLVPPEQLN